MIKISIRTIPYVQALEPEDCINQTLVVIDTFRATSTIVTALASGVKSVLPVEEIDDAIQQSKPGQMLAGERFGIQIEGFSISNSPAFFIRSSDCKGKELILTTTNGTRALSKVHLASKVWIGSLLNAKAIAQKLHQTDLPNVIFYCAGTRGTLSLEDSVTVGAIIDEWKSLDPKILRSPIPLDDLSMLCLSSYQALTNQNQVHLLKQSRSGKRNYLLGNHEDLDLCIQINRFNIAPTFHDGVIVASTSI